MLKVKVWVCASVVALLLSANSANAASIILNGDFENNTETGSQFNVFDVTFNVIVANATAFGTANEIDLVTASDFGIAPQSGAWKLGLHTQTGGSFDGFSFGLSSAVVSGASYDLGFFGALLDPQFGAVSGPIEIGLSNDSGVFGTLVYSGTPLSFESWTAFNATFIAPVNGSFLTVRTGNVADDYAFVDNFSLEQSGDAREQSDLAAVPEPASLILIGTGTASLIARRRKRSI
jgi:hypothetical protein